MVNNFWIDSRDSNSKKNCLHTILMNAVFESLFSRCLSGCLAQVHTHKTHSRKPVDCNDNKNKKKKKKLTEAVKEINNLNTTTHCKCPV